jgi:hypothetical protein
MTEQPAEPTDDPVVEENYDTASPAQKIERATRASQLANAMITTRDDMNSVAQLVEEAINEGGPFNNAGLVEVVRFLVHVIINLVYRISIYAHQLNAYADDDGYFDRKHAQAAQHQAANPKIMRLSTRDQDDDA